ncbi:MAG TPA: serine hydrolase domain-containing protein [Pyrinomonadaceae bacterium]|nr:serine hydrolase domain-containing protein [Pyrinomonadaceae bacterium]
MKNRSPLSPRRAALSLALVVLLHGIAPAVAQRAQQRFAAGALPEPRFADPERARKLAAAFPEIERLFDAWVERRRMPGAVMGVVIDGELAWVKGAGVRETEGRAPVTADTVFRIASMTKSFTALAILKLRDEGKLSLDDPASRHVPALAGLEYPTKDSPAITVRHLLTHSEGFPEDNPWGDRQLAQRDATMGAWMRQGIPFSNAPGVAFEYSNYGFAILGQIVARASGKPYEVYVRDEILRPLGMNASYFEASEVPREHVALGYRREGDQLKPEPLLAHGSFGPMGGLWTSARDLGRYVAFLMSAFPPRDEAERGPVRRASAREMQQAARAEGALAYRAAVDAPLQLSVNSYGYGLGVSQNCRFGYVVGHSGGLPGYGSLMSWLPEHGVGLIAMGNQTYSGFGGLFNDALTALHRTGALQPRVVRPSPALVEAQRDVTQLVLKWDAGLASRVAADNLFMDEPAERRAARLRELATKHGACRSAEGAIEAENALRGSWKMPCERGWLNVSVTLAPTAPPRVQSLSVRGVIPPGEEMTKAVESVLGLMRGWDAKAAEALLAPGANAEQIRRHVAASSAWGACKVRDHLGGDGARDSTVRLTCERGTLIALLSLDPETRRLKSLDLLPTRAERCVP